MGARREQVVVIGAGVFGAWTAHHLLNVGHTVTLIDAYGPANSLASSGGESRLIRAAYGRDSIYTRMARDSLPEWKALSELSGLPIFLPTGILFFFGSEEPYFLDSVSARRELGLSTQVLSSAEMAKLFPMFHFEGITIGIYEPEFGALMARRAVQTLVDRFVRAGGKYRLASVAPPGGDKRVDRLKLRDGDEIRADRFVVAAGPWLPKLFPGLLSGRIVPTRQEIFFFAPSPGERRFEASSMPSWVDFNQGDMFYGFPNLEGRGVKFAHDLHGPVVDPDTQSREASEEALAEVAAYRDRRFPLLKGARLTETRVCQYENSCNGDFLIDFHPELENVLLVGGGSGHGFKHGPEVGRYAAARLFGNIDPEPRFGLAAKTESRSREVH